MNPYNRAVRSYFAAPRHAGSLPSDARLSYVSKVRDMASRGRLELAMAVRDGDIELMRFRAYGCPHLLAAAEWVCRRFEGGAVDDLRSFEQNEVMQNLSVPIEKTGRILLLQDALTALREQYEKDN